MTDRAKKITDLQGTANLANTDLVVVAANTSDGWTSRNISVYNFAKVIKNLVIRAPQNANVYSNSVSIASNGTSNVSMLSIANSNFLSLEVTAKDISTNDYTYATVIIVNDGNNVSTNVRSVSVGNNLINFSGASISNSIVNVLFRRSTGASSNVTFNYSVSLL